MTYTHPVIK